MNERTGVTAILVALAVGTGAACFDTEDTADSITAYSVTWTESGGFVVDGEDALEIESRASLVRTRAPVVVEGNSDYMLWAVGDGIALPFDTNISNLPKDRLLPDVVVPEKIVAGTQLKVWSVFEGKLDKPVADVVIRDPSAFEVPYWIVTVTKSRCMDYCDSYFCNSGPGGYNGCGSWCGPCGSYPCSVGAATRYYSSTPNCSASSCGACYTGGNHHCWTVQRSVSCN
jgi:hypothetical protein